LVNHPIVNLNWYADSSDWPPPPNTPYLLYRYCADIKDWHPGFSSDEFWNARHLPEWTHLQVNMAEVIAASKASAPQREPPPPAAPPEVETIDQELAQGCKARERRAKRIARIEERLKATALRNRTYYRVTEIVGDRVPDNDPQRRADYFRAFELALNDGLFNEAYRKWPQLFSMDADSGFFMRLRKDRLAMYLGEPSAKDPDAKDAKAIAGRDAVVVRWKIAPAKYRARRLEDLAERTWMPRRFVRIWLDGYGLPVPPWLEDKAPAARSAAQADASQMYGNDGAAAQSGASTERPATDTAKAQASNPKKEQATDRVQGRKRKGDRASTLHKSTGAATVETAVWDVIDRHEEWRTQGTPWRWSEAQLGKEVTNHLRKLIAQGKIDPDAYPLSRDRNDQYVVSGKSVIRVLQNRRTGQT
jgi:hypothetical protein